ncbi:MAG: alpha/beta fold hydrolase, partial [Solirubrobacteraceae bacterium]
MWRPLVSGLGDREVIAFDLPGAGQSGRPLLPLRMRGISGLVSDLIPRLGVERVDVLGYSLGGVVAQEVAFRSAELVRRLILASTTPGLPCLPPNPLVA